MVKYSIISRVNIKNASSFALWILINFSVSCYINSKMAVFCDADVKCEWKGDVVAEDPSDLHLAGVCMETKQEMWYE